MNVDKLNKYVKEGVDALIQKKGADELIDSIAESMEEHLEIKKTEAKKLFAVAFEKQYDPEKFQEKRSKLEALYSHIDIVEV